MVLNTNEYSMPWRDAAWRDSVHNYALLFKRQIDKSYLKVYYQTVKRILSNSSEL